MTDKTFMDEAIRIEYNVTTEYMLTIIMFLANTMH